MTGAGCSLHRLHVPVALTSELHHCVPRAWEAAWQPPVAPFPGTYQGQYLWDARTVVLCPTGHRDVHALLVLVMHAWATGTPSPDRLDAAARTLPRRLRRMPELQVALQAPLRFVAAGGDLGLLVARGEWGEA